MYESFYGLTGRPFLMTPDPARLYWAEPHAMAFAMLRYGLMTRAPITVVTGEIGAGKTTLVRQLLREAPHDLDIGLISNMQTGRGQLLQWVMMALDEPIGDGESYVRLFQRFQTRVVESYATGRRVALIFDEAQNLSVDALEELRMLSNINADGDELLQLILVGQPQLRDLLARPELRQFSQRVSSDFHLVGLSQTETTAYIQHRLESVGAQWRILPPESCQLIHDTTRGVPRLINSLSDLCLVYGYAAEAKVVQRELVQEFLASARQRGIYDQFFHHGDGQQLVRRVF